MTVEMSGAEARASVERFLKRVEAEYDNMTDDNYHTERIAFEEMAKGVRAALAGRESGVPDWRNF